MSEHDIIKQIPDDDNLSTDGSKGPSLVQPPWDAQYEKVLIEWADKAQCYRWLHGRSFALYRVKAMWYTIPVIIMSTITGTANFAQERFPANIKTMAVITIGSINLIAGIITTISQYLKVNELLESHRAANLSWDKFVRDVKMELAKDPREHGDVPGQREPPITCMTKFKETFDRLMEVSPSIEDNVLAEFAFRFDEDKIRITKELKSRKQRILYGDETGDGVAPWLRPAVKFFKCYDCFSDPKDIAKREKKIEQKQRETKWKSANPRQSIRDFYDLESQLYPDMDNKNTTPRNDIAQKVKDEITAKNKNISLRKPDILGELNSVEHDIHPWRDEEEIKKLNGPDLEAKAIAKAEFERDEKLRQRKNNQEEILREQILAQEEEEHQIELMRMKDSIGNRITNYIIKFKTKWHRVPLVDDVIEALSDIDEDEIRTHDLLVDNISNNII
jgi:hypothetical protein